jgi:hypothetical protein
MSAKFLDPNNTAWLMAVAADPKTTTDRLAKLTAASKEHGAIKLEALKLKAEAEKLAAKAAEAMSSLVRDRADFEGAREDHTEAVSKAEQALVMRIQACDDREKDLALREQALKAERVKLSADINDHARYRERNASAHELKMVEVSRREGLVIEREKSLVDSEKSKADWDTRAATLASVIAGHMGIR